MKKHYENFPVASIVLPKRFRRPVGIIYSFARNADDFADEGERSNEARLELLNGYRSELEKIAKGIESDDPLFIAIGEIIRQHDLPIQFFHDLLDAFSQDVEKKSYEDFETLLHYCRRSANPVGRLLICLYGIDSEENRAWSDHICTSLQLINFLQDVAVDLAMGRVYLPADEIESFGLSKLSAEDPAWQPFMKHQSERAKAMMLEGAPLAGKMKGRLAFEMRLIILGGLRILEKLENNQWDVFEKRPRLEKADWLVMIFRAIFNDHS